RGAEQRARPWFTKAPTQDAVVEAERGAVAPAQRHPEVPVLPSRHMGQMHDRRHDLPGYERVVVVERAAAAPAHPTLDVIEQGQCGRAGRAGDDAPDGPRRLHSATTRSTRSSPSLRCVISSTD